MIKEACFLVYKIDKILACLIDSSEFQHAKALFRYLLLSPTPTLVRSSLYFVFSNSLHLSSVGWVCKSLNNSKFYWIQFNQC